MSVRRVRLPGGPTLRARRTVAGVSLAALVCAGLAGCSDGAIGNAGPGKSDDEPAAQTVEDKAPPVEISTNLPRGSAPIDRTLKVSATGGELQKVNVRSAEGSIAGKISADGSSWVASKRLEPGQKYTVTTISLNEAGDEERDRTRFNTVALTLDQQTYADVSPLDGETVGVGMPVIINFDVPVTDRASIEKHLKVTSAPAQAGAFHWASDKEVHWRPRAYWKPGTKVTVNADINSVPAGGGIYGQESRTVNFTVGDSVISKVNAQTHQMKTFINGKLAKTMPITTGKPGFTTRSGVKVIIEKFRTKRMNSETVGINQGDPEAYDIDNVEYAMRVTYSGEFLHAAPWSVGSQGYANVSHGCTGLSTANAEWIYNNSKRGDVVEYTGTDRQMDLYNGYGDWNASFGEYSKGSAL